MNERSPDMESLTRQIKDQVPDVYAYRSQKVISFSIGYARVEFPNGNATTAKGRAEGDEGEPTMLNRIHELTGDDWEDLFVDWAVEILRTGRTIECGKGVGLAEINTQPHYESCDIDMRSIPDYVGGTNRNVVTPWDLDPDYQRNHVWTNEQAENFIGHILEGGSVPLIFLQRYDCPDNAPEGTDYWTLPVEVIDGKQRLMAILRWVKGEIAAQLTDDRLIWYRALNEVERRRLPRVKVAFLDISREERLRFYLRLNRGGTVHTEDEINKVRDLIRKERPSDGSWRKQHE